MNDRGGKRCSNELVLTFAPTLENSQWATIAAREITAALLRTASEKKTGDHEAFLSAVELATGEACTNAVKYGPGGGEDTAPISVVFTLEESKLVISISDCNEAFNLPVKQPDFEDVPDHGYGIYIMKKVMDQVIYRRQDGRNIITLEKKIVSTEEGK